jgi:hypothetical protein
LSLAPHYESGLPDFVVFTQHPDGAVRQVVLGMDGAVECNSSPMQLDLMG